jgi:hypothetical protein
MFYLLSVLAGGFSNILAYGLAQMEGIGNLQGIAVAAWFIIIDFPDQKNRFISAQDAEILKKRINDDRGDAVLDTVTWAKLGGHFLDWKLWAL